MRTVILSALLLSACSGDARSLRLTELDLTDMATVRDIRNRLGPADASAFATYAVRHNTTSAGFCGHPLLDPTGKPPRTIGDAIDLTLARESDELKARIAAARPRTEAERINDKWAELIRQRDRLIDRQTILRAQQGPAAERAPEWKSLETKMAASDGELSLLKPKVFGSAN